jgi:hypothetical protein
MFVEPDKLLRSTRGTVKERPLPLLFHALFATRRTAALELKRQAFEKTLVFESGVPVGCHSNLVHESIGRYLVDRKAITEDVYLKVLATSARRELRFEKVLFEERLIDPAVLQHHQLANLAQKILDAFRWTDAQYRLVADVEIDPDAPRMNAPLMLYTAVCIAVPGPLVRALFPFPAFQRFALVGAPPVKLDDLKLAARDARLAAALAKRASLADLCAAAELDEESARRRLCAWSLLGLVDTAENVPEEKPAPPPPPPLSLPEAPPRPATRSSRDSLPVMESIPPIGRADPFAARAREAARRRRRVAILVACGVVLIAGAAVGLNRFLKPPEGPVDETQVVFEVAPRSKPVGTLLPRAEAVPLPAAPKGAKPYSHHPRELAISASGIALEPPEPLIGRNHQSSVEASRLLAVGKAAEAQEIFARLAREHPTEPRAPYGAALACYLVGKDDEARASNAKALELAAEFADAHLLAAYLDELAGKSAEAVLHYQAFLKAEPNSPRADDVRTLVDRLNAAR